MLTKNNSFNIAQSQQEGISISRTFVANVFLWMFLALAITAATSYFFASDPKLIGS